MTKAIKHLTHLKRFFSKEYKYSPKPFVLHEVTLQDYIESQEKRKAEYNSNRNFWNIVDDCYFEITYQYRSILDYWYGFTQGISNLWKYKKVVYCDRWYDHSYLMTMLRFKLQDMYDNWDSAHYVDSEKEKADIGTMLALIDKYNSLDDINYSEEKEKAKKEFFELLSDRLEYLWD